MSDDSLTPVPRQQHRLTIGGALLVAIAAVPVLAIVLLVLRYSVPIPLLDDWEMVPIVTDAHEHHLTFGQLFEQQQEARTFFPKLFFLLFSVAKHWDSRVAMMFSVLICCLIALGIYRLLRYSGISSRASAVAILLALPLIFSPAQHELWLLASGFPSFIPALCVVWGLCVLLGRASIAAKFWLCLGLAVLASFSLPNGLLIWGLTFPAVFAMGAGRKELRWFGWWWLASAICAVIYFWGFHSPQDLPPFAPSKPFTDYIKYLAAFLGSGLARAGFANPLSSSIAVGIVVLTGYAGAIGHSIFRCRNAEYCRRVMPWLALATYSIASGCLAALGRIEWGVAQALESRYVAFSLYGVVGLIGFASVLCKDMLAATPRRDLRAAIYGGIAITGGAYFTLYLVCAAASVASFQWRSAAARMGNGGVLFSQVLDTSKTIQAGNFPRPWQVQQRSAALDRLHMLRTPLVRTTRISDLRHADLSGEPSGWLDGISVHEGKASAWGWAAAPSNDRPADCVVLAYEDERGEWIAFALSNAVVPRPDVARVLKNREQVWSGWSAEFPVAAVPKGARLSAWGLDAKAVKLYRLNTKDPSPSL
ncbi:MAG: hypothetical protein ACJ8M4_06785 [Chthoniobacterales bacterium]